MWIGSRWLAALFLLSSCGGTLSVAARRDRNEELAASLVALTGEHRAAVPFAYDGVAEIPRDWRTLPSVAVVLARDAQAHVVANDEVVLGLTDRILTAWRTDDGAELWMRSSPHRTGVVLAGDVAVLMEPTDVTVIATATGENVWSHPIDPTSTERVSHVAVRDGVLEVVLRAPDDAVRVMQLSLEDGAVVSRAVEASAPPADLRATARAVGLVEVTASDTVAVGFRGRDVVVLGAGLEGERVISTGPELSACLRDSLARAFDDTRLLVACPAPDVLVEVDLVEARIRSIRTGVGAVRGIDLTQHFAVLHRVRASVVVDLELDGGSQREHLSREDDTARTLQILDEDETEPADAPWLYPRSADEAARWLVRLDETGEVTARALEELALGSAARLMRAVNAQRRPPDSIALALLHRTYGERTVDAVQARIAALAGVSEPLELDEADRLATATIAWLERVGLGSSADRSKEIFVFRRDEAPSNDVGAAVLAGRNVLLRLSRSRAPLDRIAEAVAYRGGVDAPTVCPPNGRDAMFAAVFRWRLEFERRASLSVTATGASCVAVSTLSGEVSVGPMGEAFLPPCEITETDASRTAFPDAPTFAIPAACVGPAAWGRGWVVQEIDGLWRVVAEIE